jgi:hypothetical protein
MTSSLQPNIHLQPNTQQKQAEALVVRLDRMNFEAACELPSTGSKQVNSSKKTTRISGSETSASTSSNEENSRKQPQTSSRPQPQPQPQPQQRQQQEELRDAVDHELVELKLPKLGDQMKSILPEVKKQEPVPDTIIITNKDYIDGDDDDDDDDDDVDNCSLISGLTLPQEIVLLRTIAETHHHQKQQRKKKKQTNTKTKNKVSSKSTTSIPSTSRRRPTTDAGDFQPNRAQNMEIRLIINGQLVRGTYSGSLSHTAPRRPNGVGVIKFDNGDMYIGDVKDGNLHGQGTFINGDTVLRGEFEHNLFEV